MSSRTMQAMQQAEALYHSGQWPAAEQLCRSILSADPRHFAALNLLAMIAAGPRRSQETAGLLQRAIAARPQDPAAHSNYGDALRDLGRYQEALESYSRALELAPQRAELHCNCGAI